MSVATHTVHLFKKIEERKKQYFSARLDSHQSRQVELDLEAELFLVANGLELGPSICSTGVQKLSGKWR
jgi:hypothetical protein